MFGDAARDRLHREDGPRQVVDAREVLLVDRVDQHHVRVAALAEPVGDQRLGFLAGELRHLGQRLRRRLAGPEPDHAVAFGDGKAAHAHARARRAGKARDVAAAAVRFVAPAMEEAAQRVALDAALGQVRAHVRAVRVQRHDAAVDAAVDGEVAPQQPHGHHAAAPEVARSREPVPALHDRVRSVEDARLHHRSRAPATNARRAIGCSRSAASSHTHTSSSPRA